MSSSDSLQPPAPNIPLQYVDEAARQSREERVDLEKSASRLNIHYYRDRELLFDGLKKGLGENGVLSKLYALDKDNTIFSQIARDLGCSDTTIQEKGGFKALKESVDHLPNS